MANIATVFKDEISRLSRKEVRSETDKLKKSAAQYKSEIASLKRRIDALEKQVTRLTKVFSSSAEPKETSEISTRSRFTAKGFKTLRQRLGLTAEVLAELLDVSPATIYSWEVGKSKPRDAQMEKIIVLRGMGKKDVAAILKRLTE